MKKEIKQKLEKYQKQYTKIFRKIRDIEDEEVRINALPALKKSVGQCYKYLNSYGGDKEKWFLYIKIISIDESTMTFKCVEFQKTSIDKIEIGYNKKYNWNGMNAFSDSFGNYIKITTSEYNRAKKSLNQFVEKILKN